MTAFYQYQLINKQSFGAPFVGGNPAPHPLTTKNHPSKKGLKTIILELLKILSKSVKKQGHDEISKIS